MIDPDRVLAHLYEHHRGAGNGVSARSLALDLSCSERDLRQAVMTLRERGHAVCALPTAGDSLGNSDDELTLAFKDRADSSLAQLSTLRTRKLPQYSCSAWPRTAPCQSLYGNSDH